jgi:hypothetical protein
VPRVQGVPCVRGGHAPGLPRRVGGDGPLLQGRRGGGARARRPVHARGAARGEARPAEDDSRPHAAASPRLRLARVGVRRAEGRARRFVRRGRGGGHRHAAQESGRGAAADELRRPRRLRRVGARHDPLALPARAVPSARAGRGAASARVEGRRRDRVARRRVARTPRPSRAGFRGTRDPRGGPRSARGRRRRGEGTPRRRRPRRVRRGRGVALPRDEGTRRRARAAPRARGADAAPGARPRGVAGHGRGPRRMDAAGPPRPRERGRERGPGPGPAGALGPGGEGAGSVSQTGSSPAVRGSPRTPQCPPVLGR